MKAGGLNKWLSKRYAGTRLGRVLTIRLRHLELGNALVLQWLGLNTFIAVPWVQSLVRQLKIPQTMQQGQKKKKTFGFHLLGHRWPTILKLRSDRMDPSFKYILLLGEILSNIILIITSKSPTPPGFPPELSSLAACFLLGHSRLKFSMSRPAVIILPPDSLLLCY